MVTIILNLVQPLAVVIFLIAGFLCLATYKWHEALINLSIANANFWIFYGDKIIK